MMIMRTLSFLLLALIFIVSAPHQANAQSAPVPQELLDDKPAEAPQQIQPDAKTVPEPQTRKENALPFKRWEDIPQEIIDEAQAFHDECAKSPRLPTHYNCQCWGQRFLEERIKLGPNADKSYIVRTINRECIDEIAATGYAYERCQKQGMALYNGGMSPDEFCECIANNYYILLRNDDNFSMTSRTTGALYSSAAIRCQPRKQGVPNLFPRLDIRPGQENVR